MNRLNIANGLRLAVLLMLLAFIGLVVLQASLSAQSLLEVKLVTTTEMVKAAEGIARDYYQRAQRGELSEREAQQAAARDIKEIRYSGSEYIWINDMTPRMVAHPTKPELEGKDLTNNQDPRGKYMFREMVAAVAANGSGLVDYMWPKPGADEPVPKRSYVQGFAPWGWVLGSGVYIDDVAAISRRNSMIAFGLIAVFALAAGIGAELYSRKLRQRIARMRRMVAAVASGDLSQHISVDHADEIGLVITELATMQQSLVSLLEHIRAPIISIESAANEVARGGFELSSSTERAAASLEQTSSAMTQFTALSSQLAQTAAESEGLANTAAGSAATGSKDMEQAAAIVEAIAQSSNKIADIIKIIDGVAFQTNLLALNASVEAARAGDHGRGFNVVAEEVRKLAQEAAKSAADIKHLIEESADRVNEGVSQIQTVRESMDELVSSVDTVTRRVVDISQASREQAAGIADVSGAIQQLDSLTQQNAALAEESNASAEELLQQARRLQELVAVFQLPSSTGSETNVPALPHSGR